MASYTPTIGLEIHAELATATKMFCNSRNDPDETRPNVNVCPVCMAHPGTLPVANREAVRQVLRVGAALGGTLADYTEFDRKNYFYPDLPKGYQISQYEFPLVSGGTLADVELTRIHLEEDTARSQHADGGWSLVDFNRAGVPLMELVTEPVIHDAHTASAFARELQLLLRYLGAGEANMEKGEMRVEANISIAKEGSTELGTKVEVKNLNSFRAVERAIEYEIKRQAQLLERGEKVIQETRGWDEGKEETASQRLKESSHDYRYFPDPDIPKFKLSRIAEFGLENIAQSLPELPWQKRERLRKLGFLKPEDIEQLVNDSQLEKLFEVATQGLPPKDQRFMANLILNDVAGKRQKDSGWALPSSEFVREVSSHYVGGSMTSTQAKASILLGSAVLKADSSLLPAIVQKVFIENPKVVEEVKKGKIEALKYLIGRGMKESKGSANPQEIERLMREELGV